MHTRRLQAKSTAGGFPFPLLLAFCRGFGHLRRMNAFQKPVESLLFFSRWLQLPMYLGLVAAQCAYAWLFMRDVWHMFGHLSGISEKELLVIILGLIDMVMVSNLLIMVIVGGYETFVSRIDSLKNHPDKPEWLAHIDAAALKVKLATALITISSIHLLKSFFDADKIPPQQVALQIALHFTFMFSAILLAWTNRMSFAGADKH